jgi:hypothetical protein
LTQVVTKLAKEIMNVKINKPALHKDKYNIIPGIVVAIHSLLVSATKAQNQQRERK